MIPSYWQDAVAHLTLRDEVLAGLIVSYGDEVLLSQGSPFQTLIKAVVGQQISVKAAEAIWQRLKRQLETISPKKLLTVEAEQLRQCGLSRQKIDYLTAIRLHYGSLTKSEILTLSSGWQPYRTVATWYLWRSLDPVAVQY
jgi:DNA-3-methyladenine glycosylase II